MKERIEWLSIAAVAERMNTTPLNVLMHIKRGLLRGIEEDNAWTVEARSLDALLAKTGGHRNGDVCAGGCAKHHKCSGSCR
jgi:hypothetical protein